MAKNKGGRPPYKPTDSHRKTVKAMSGYGVPQREIAKVLGISHPTMVKNYRHELDTAATEANSQVAQSLFKKATGDGASSVTAAIFWLKTRAGWKEPRDEDRGAEDLVAAFMKMAERLPK